MPQGQTTSGKALGFIKNLINSPNHGRFDLARPEDRKRLRKVVIDLQRQTDRLTQHDIRNWRMACQLAQNVDNPNRQALYDIYADVDLDNHLSGTVGQINDYVKARSFKLIKPDGKADDDALKIFDCEWFKDLLDYILESRNWGHSLVELGDVVTLPDGRMSFTDVKLIPRKHVVPEYGRITKEVGDDWRKGIDYRQPPYSDWLIEIGKSNDLGLFRKAAMHTIPKKYAMSFWDTFAEMFGMPIRIAQTSSRDQKDINEISKMMEQMGANAWGVFGDDTDIKFEESSRGDAFNVYDKRIERANSELSKLFLHQTMTIDDGSSLSQSQTHLKVLEHLIGSYSDMVRDVINNKLLPLMVRHGFPVKGLTFEWDDAVDYTPSEQLAFEKMIVENYDVPGSYFEEKYGVPAGERRNQGITPPQPSQPSQGSKNSKEGTSVGFFD